MRNGSAICTLNFYYSYCFYCLYCYFKKNKINKKEKEGETVLFMAIVTATDSSTDDDGEPSSEGSHSSTAIGRAERENEGPLGTTATATAAPVPSLQLLDSCNLPCRSSHHHHQGSRAGVAIPQSATAEEKQQQWIDWPHPVPVLQATPPPSSAASLMAKWSKEHARRLQRLAAAEDDTLRRIRVLTETLDPVLKRAREEEPPLSSAPSATPALRVELPPLRRSSGGRGSSAFMEQWAVATGPWMPSVEETMEVWLPTPEFFAATAAAPLNGVAPLQSESAEKQELQQRKRKQCEDGARDATGLTARLVRVSTIGITEEGRRYYAALNEALQQRPCRRASTCFDTVQQSCMTGESAGLADGLHPAVEPPLLLPTEVKAEEDDASAASQTMAPLRSPPVAPLSPSASSATGDSADELFAPTSNKRPEPPRRRRRGWDSYGAGSATESLGLAPGMTAMEILQTIPPLQTVPPPPSIREPRPTGGGSPVKRSRPDAAAANRRRGSAVNFSGQPGRSDAEGVAGDEREALLLRGYVRTRQQRANDDAEEARIFGAFRGSPSASNDATARRLDNSPSTQPEYWAINFS